MYIHTEFSDFFVVFAGFLNDAIFRAGGGCVGLAIQNYGAVHVCASFMGALRAWTRDRTYLMKVKGKANKPKHVNS